MTLAIIAGRGDLPEMLIKQCLQDNKPHILLLIEGEEYGQELLAHNHYSIPIGHIGKALKIMHDNQISELVFAGTIKKPALSNIKVDSKGAILLAKIVGAKFWGDDNMLNIVVNFFEKEGFRVLGIEEILPSLLAKEGALGKVKIKDKGFLEDARLGYQLLLSLSPFDVGQSVVVQQKQILGIEGREGTDLLIQRCSALAFKEGRAPILVKSKKIDQNNKIDLPAFGPVTLQNLKEANFAGVVLEAGSCLVIDQPFLKDYANQHHLFIQGFSSDFFTSVS